MSEKAPPLPHQTVKQYAIKRNQADSGRFNLSVKSEFSAMFICKMLINRINKPFLNGFVVFLDRYFIVHIDGGGAIFC